MGSMEFCFLFIAVFVQKSSTEFDSWKKLNRGGTAIGIAANKLALYLIDGSNQLKAIDSDAAAKHIGNSIRHVAVDDDYSLMVAETGFGLKSRVGVASSNAIGTSWKVLEGAGRGMATGRHGLLLHWNAERTYEATGITASDREGTGWTEIATGAMKEISCGKLQCFSVTASGDLYSSGLIPSGYSPTFLDPKLKWAKIASNVKDVSTYTSNTLWKLDSNGIAWKAANVIGQYFVKFNWERKTFQGLNFTKIAVTDKIQYAISNDNNIHVLTGCPIFDFEDNDLSHWTRTGMAFNKQPVVSQQTNYSRLSGKVGDRTIDTFSSRTSYDMAEDSPESTQGDSITGTLTSPLFQIRTKSLHFVIGGGSPPNNFASLYVDGAEVFQASGKSTDKTNAKGLIRAGRHSWDVSSYINKCAFLKLVDSGTGIFGHTIFDDLCASPPCFKGITVGLEKSGHNGNVKLGQEIKYKLDMKGFYTSKTRPLSINISFPIKDGEPYVFIKSISVLSHKCATSAKGKKVKTSIQPNLQHYFSYLLTYNNYILSDFVLEVVARVYDHKSLQLNIPKQLHGSIKVNFADEYLQTINHNITVTRAGNEIATMSCIEKMITAEYFHIGDNITYNVELSLTSSSQQRVFNVMLKLFLLPYLTVLEVKGKQSSLGDVQSSPSSSQTVLGIRELHLDDMRNISFIMSIRSDYGWGKLYSKQIPGLFLVDAISYCVRQTCRNAQGNSSEIITVVKNKQYSFNIRKKDETRKRKYTSINVKNGSLVIICGSYDAHGKRDHARCYYGNASTNTWSQLPNKLTEVLYYDEAAGKIYGKFSNTVKAELYGDIFKEHKILTESEWSAVTAREQSLVASKSVEEPERSVRRNLNGKLPYQWECCLNTG